MSADASGCLSPSERFLIFDCNGSACVGVLAIPANENALRKIGVVVVVGGPQYRVGSHRQFRLLSMELAKAGISVLRFDYRGMGDSEGETRTFESIGDDLAAAIGVFQRETNVTRVVLWGLCDGASAAIIYAAHDPCIAGIVAVNPWAQPPQGTASTRLKHYYFRRLFSLAFWRNILQGEFKARTAGRDFFGVIRGIARDSSHIAAMAYSRRLQEGWARFQRPMLFILSGNDLTAREFERWIARDKHRTRLFHGSCSELHIIQDADHTFSRRAWRDAVSRRTIEWIHRLT